jgi:hypothetical protein
MPSHTTKAQCRHVLEGARKRRKSACIGLKILTVILPLLLFILVALLIAGSTTLVGQIVTAQGKAIWTTPGVGLPIFLIFFIPGVFFSSLAAYFSHLVRMPQFVTLYIRRPSGADEKGQQKEILTLSRRLWRFFSGPYSTKWLRGFEVIYSVITVWYVLASAWTALTGGLQAFSIINLMSALFLLSLLACFLLAYRVLKGSENIAEVPAELPLDNRIQEIAGVLPRRVHVGESHDILIEFSLSQKLRSATPAKTDVIPHDAHFEAELRAAGVSVDKKTRLLTTASSPTCVWNCYFQNKGSLTVNFILSEVRSDDINDVVFAHKQDIKVDSAFSASVQPVITVIVSILSAIVALKTIIWP